jgi:hypothetical protein
VRAPSSTFAVYRSAKHGVRLMQSSALCQAAVSSHAASVARTDGMLVPLARMLARMQARMHTELSHRHSHARTHAHTCSPARLLAHTCAHSLLHTLPRSLHRACMQAVLTLTHRQRPHSHTDTQTHRHTQIHRHKDIYSPVWFTGVLPCRRSRPLV